MIWSLYGVLKIRKKALDKAFNNDFLETKTCINPIADNYLIARDLKVNGTPMIYMEDGVRNTRICFFR